jgi:hypothetical protein
MKRASAIKSSDPDSITSCRDSGIENEIYIGYVKSSRSSLHQTSFDFRQLGEIE